jgi:hypothetical protein
MSEDERRFTERFGPNHEDGYQCLDELVQRLGKILREIHKRIPDKDAAFHADVVAGCITSLYTSLAWRAGDLESVLLMLRNDEDKNDPINDRIEQAFVDHFDYSKAELRQHLIEQLLQEEDA